MGRRRQKRKSSHIVIVTSDAVDGKTKQFRIRPWAAQILVLLVCALAGAVIGIIYFETNVWTAEKQESARQKERIADLEAENEALKAQIQELNADIQILSETVASKTASESLLSEQLGQQYLPTEFPLTGSATMEEMTDEDSGAPICVFTAAEGAMVVATAGGTVSAVNDDASYGHNVWVDHGNGYVTVYRNQGEVKVKQGETVTQGSTLFLVDGENNRLGYQMMRDGAYIDPMEMLAISG